MTRFSRDDKAGGPSDAPASKPLSPARIARVSIRAWADAYRAELLVFLIAAVVFASMSSFRFLRQSEAPHFVYQAMAFLDGRLDVKPDVLPNLEDWACVRDEGDAKVRCEGPPRATDRWYVSFPWFPAAVMLPFVALHGYQFNDTSFTVLVGALALAFFYSLLRFLSQQQALPRTDRGNFALALVLGFGTLFFYCTIRGEVWFTAEVLGVLFTCPYIRNSVGARRPIVAGLFCSMATLTRTPLAFTGIFFLLECLFPAGTPHREQLRTLPRRLEPVLRKLGLFVVGAAPLALLAIWMNFERFGSVTEFGHSFLFNNRVNSDIDRYGLFDTVYLRRNLEAAFLMLPPVSLRPPALGYDPRGMSMLLTMPWLIFLLVPKRKSPLQPHLLAAALACALPGLLYQNTGYMQFGFRFSVDYTPYLLLLFATGGWPLRSRWVIAAMALAFAVNFWGAVAFRGYTELVRHW